MPIGTPFGMVIGFINHLQVVTMINYNIVTHLQLLHANFSLYLSVLIAHSLDHTLQIKPSNHKIHLHTTNFPWLLLKTLKQSQIHRWILLHKFTPGTVRELTANCFECRRIHFETELLAPMVSRITPLHGPHGKRSPYCCKLCLRATA
jgi:hypothetical protein